MAMQTYLIDPEDGTLYSPAPRGSQPRPVQEWARAAGADKATPTGRQQVDAEGLPLWEADVLAVRAGFNGSEALETITVRWAARMQPEGIPGTVIA